MQLRQKGVDNGCSRCAAIRYHRAIRYHMIYAADSTSLAFRQLLRLSSLKRFSNSLTV